MKKLILIIAKHIPTKRELKRAVQRRPEASSYNCKAHPDEKGIETWLDRLRWLQTPEHCKAHPDEKGIET